MIRLPLIACVFLASASALAQNPPSAPPVGGGLPFPVVPSDTVSVVKALAHSTADLEKFISLNPKAQISQAQVTYQDDGYQITITSQTCDVPAPPALPPVITVPDEGAIPGGMPVFNPLPPVNLVNPCKTYGSLVIQATADAEVQDGYTYQVLWNGTLRRK